MIYGLALLHLNTNNRMKDKKRLLFFDFANCKERAYNEYIYIYLFWSTFFLHINRLYSLGTFFLLWHEKHVYLNNIKSVVFRWMNVSISFPF